MKNNKNIYAHGSMLLALAAALLFVPLGLMAQEEDAPAEENGTTGQLKPAMELGAPFADNAILQRELPVPVWGWSKPGTTITVEFAGQKKSSKTGKDGKWMLTLDPLKASFNPVEMIVAEKGGQSVTLTNILVGEVWFASGQSNMQWPASKCDVGMVLQKQITERVKAGTEKPPVIRESKVTNYFAALHPVEHATAEWSLDATQFSGIAYAFAYELFRELDVPIGILNCSFSQTSIQAWTPRIGFRDGEDDYTKAIYQKVQETDPNSPEHKAAWGQYYTEVERALKERREIPLKVPGNMNDNRDASWMFNARLNPMIPYAVRGGIWNQGYANIGEGLAYYNNLHSLIHGWRMMWGIPDLPVYFNQFYCPGADTVPSIGEMAEMRLGTWLARDIPHAGMASQIDITGAIHYFNKTLSGQRLALHALKNEYGKNVVADGPMFKSYRVEGNQVLVELENADGGLVVAETLTTATAGLGRPTVVADGAKAVKLFYVAGEDRVWFPAEVALDGSALVVMSPEVNAPRGVSYGTGGIGNQPNLYNQALLPLTPFITYDHEMVMRKTWPGGVLTVDGVEIDPGSIGLKYEYRKMPLLSNQFRDNAVLQAGQPIIIRGSALHDFGYEAKGTAEIKFSFAGVEKTIPVTPGMKEWQVTVPAMEASAEPRTLNVTFTIDGELAHERVCTNIVIGDVWYVAAPEGVATGLPAGTADSTVRMMSRKSKEIRAARPRRFNVSTSNALDSRFASVWEPADGFAAALGQRLKARTGRPMGIVVMQSAGGKGVSEPDLKSWIDWEYLDRAPSLMADFEQLASLRPGSKYYEANVRRYVDAWKMYWGEYIPALVNTKAVPDGVAWGSYPTLGGEVTTDAAQVYNVMVSPFTPGFFRGIIFLANKPMVSDDEGQAFGEQMSALANCWKEKLGGDDTQFIYTIPDTTLAPKITRPGTIKGRHTGVEISNWSDWDKVIEAAAP